MRSSTAGRCLLVALIFSASIAAAQPAPVVIRGRVVAEDNDRPLRRALVALTGGDGRTRPVLTDDEGRFEIQRPSASALLTVTKAGYASTRFTPRPARGASSGQASVQESLVRMPRGGVISGRLFDSNGETAVGTKVVARLDDGSSDAALTFEAEADDLGEYRISGLPAGRYVVSPTVNGTRVLTVADYERFQELIKLGRRLQDVLLEPRGPSRLAEVSSGDETGNIDFEVPAGSTIRGLAPVMNRVQVTVPPGTPPSISHNNTGPVTSIVIGNPQKELGGGRVVSMFGNEGPRSLDLTLTGGAAVSGTVVDSAGEPFEGVTVRALQARNEGGRRVARAVGWHRVTDDRGRYRLFGLAPGSYLIVASLDAAEFTAGGSSTTGLTPLYFPGTTRIDAAQTLQAEGGSDLTGTDLTFAAAPVVRITGKALDAIGQPLVGRVLLGVSQRSSSITTDARPVRTGREGSFEFIDVPPGDYVLQAMADAGFGGPAEFGSEYVTVTDGDPPPVVIATSRGATLEGRFVVEGVQDAPMRAYSLHAAPLDLDRSPAGGRGPSGLAVHDDGRFYLTGLHGLMRLTAPNTLPGWYLKSVTIGGVDVTDTPYDFGSVEATVVEAEIVLSNSGAAVAGSIEPQAGSRVTASTVIAFSTNRDNWFDGSRHVKRTSSGPNGSFDINGLPPGEYYVAAVDAAAPLDWRAPDTLDLLVPRAERVTAREGAVSEVALRFVRR